MTTIAFDGYKLAGDTQSTQSYMARKVATKVYSLKMPDGVQVLFGASADEQDVMLIKEWIENGMTNSTRPVLEKDSCNAILVTRDQCFRMDSKLFCVPVLEKFAAVGNGRDYAIAAMHCGKSAREAIEIAAHYDIYTSAPVTQVGFDD